MKILTTAIPDVKLIAPQIFSDERGLFYEAFHDKRYHELAGIHTAFVQDNISYSKNNILRGLHLQTQNPQGKLVTVLAGSVYDVVVDLRHNSPTFGKWTGATLSDENRYQLWIPPGFAHGFYVLSETAVFMYKCTDYYNAQFEVTLRYDDVDLNINWPIQNQPILSAKDAAGLSLQAVMRLL